MDVKELYEQFQITPINQAILLVGKHGIGKSKIIDDYFSKLGYRIVTLFLGQAADAGDIIGLPDKHEVELENGTIQKFTDFNPPKWWPHNMNEKLVIFLDEVNRGKPEIMQCIMDMVLNRKLNGRSLPKETRIIAAMNPSLNGYYQVEDLDPALRDRFNIIEFKPSDKSWIEYAQNNGVNEVVMGFISRHPEMLDPPSEKDSKSDGVYPSRRSWERVSDTINANPKLLEGNRSILTNYLYTCVGIRAASAFDKYVREVGSGVNAEQILNSWTTSLREKISKMQLQETIHLSNTICLYFRSNIDALKDKNNEDAKVWVVNLEKFLEVVNAEVRANFYGNLAEYSKTETWTRYIVTRNPRIGTDFMEIIAAKK